MIILRIGFLVAVLGMFACTRTSLSGGNGSETTNGRVIGRILEDHGRPAAQTRVALVSDGHDPVKDGPVPDSMTGTTDSLGNFVFVNVHYGRYVVCAVHPNTGGRTVIRGIQVSDDKPDTLTTDTLRPPGTVIVMLPPNANTVSGYLYIPGTLAFAFLKNSSDFVILDSVPGTTKADVYYSSTNSSAATVFRYAVPVSSGDTATVYNPGWNYARSLVLNTAASGAEITGTVTNFPVLIRLTGVNFDFTQAKNNGEDIRFAKPDNTFLPFEIERWDPVSKLAEMWVKVDTIHGNNSTQSITMYWGNAETPAQANSAAVFDTAAGFAGVWHLGEHDGNLMDATGDHYNGNGTAQRISGAIGYGQYFNGSSDFVNIGNVCNPDTADFSFCAWIKPIITQGFITIVSKSQGGSASSSYGWLLELDKTGGLMAFMATGAGAWGGSQTFVMGSSTQITDTAAWHFIAAVFDRSGNAQCRLYIDGADVSSAPAGDIAGLGALVNSAPLRLGADANGGCPWKGSLDECSLSFGVRSPDWIKLCFMNQKQNDKLVLFK